LQGLDEVSDGSLPAAATAFLTHSSPAVRSAAVHAVGRHGGDIDVPELLTPLLQDGSGKVVTAALRYLRGYTLPPDVLARLDAVGTPRSRRAALAVRQQLSPWERVHADLAAMNGPDSGLAEAARADLLAWLRHGAAVTYGKPGTRQAAEIAELLRTPKLSNTQRRDVAFIAGLPAPTAAPQPG
jgi:HEAT repeat protein